MLQPTAVCVLAPLRGDIVCDGTAATAIAEGLAAAAAQVRADAQSMSAVYGKLGCVIHASDLEIAVRPMFGRIVIAVRQIAQAQHPAVAIEFASILAGSCVQALLQQAAPDDLCRGAVCYGPGSLADGDLHGPVFQEALAMADQGVGAVVWLAPSALAEYATGSMPSQLLGDYEIQVAGGGSLAGKALRLRLDPPALAEFTRRAGRGPDLRSAVCRAQSLRYLAWIASRA